MRRRDLFRAFAGALLAPLVAKAATSPSTEMVEALAFVAHPLPSPPIRPVIVTSVRGRHLDPNRSYGWLDEVTP